MKLENALRQFNRWIWEWIFYGSDPRSLADIRAQWQAIKTAWGV